MSIERARTTSVSDREIKRAAGIYTVDPSDPDAAGHHLWGERSEVVSEEASGDQNGAVLEIELHSDDHLSLLDLIDRIDRQKGSLPPDVVVLRKKLRG